MRVHASFVSTGQALARPHFEAFAVSRPSSEGFLDIRQPDDDWTDKQPPPRGHLATGRHLQNISCIEVPSIGKTAAAPRWYPLRVYFSGAQKILAVEKSFKAAGMETFVPLAYKKMKVGGKEQKQLLPVVTDILFVRATEGAIRQQVTEAPNEPAPIQHVSFIFRRIGVFKDDSKIIVISDKEMDNFIRAVKGNEEYIIYLQPGEVTGKTSRPITIKGGRFDNVRGELIRVQGNRHVVVRLDSFAIAAITYIPIANVRFEET